MSLISKCCIVCGKKLKIEMDENRNILSGGYYFGEVEIPARDAKVVKKWKDKIDELEVTVVEYSDYEKFEYWECEECYTED